MACVQTEQVLTCVQLASPNSAEPAAPHNPITPQFSKKRTRQVERDALLALFLFSRLSNQIGPSLTGCQLTLDPFLQTIMFPSGREFVRNLETSGM
jgi:hypothetical protein